MQEGTDRNKDRRQTPNENMVEELAAAMAAAAGKVLGSVAGRSVSAAEKPEDSVWSWLIEGSILGELSEVYEQLPDDTAGKKERLMEALEGLEMSYSVNIEEMMAELVKSEGVDIESAAMVRILAVRLEFIEDLRTNLETNFGFYAAPGPRNAKSQEYWNKEGLGWMQGSVFEEIKIVLEKGLYLPSRVGMMIPTDSDWEFFGELNEVEMAAYFVQEAYLREANKLRKKNSLSERDMEKIDVCEARAYLLNRFLWSLVKEEIATEDGIEFIAIAANIIYVA